jgi:penicillin-binding protein 1B
MLLTASMPSQTVLVARAAPPRPFGRTRLIVLLTAISVVPGLPAISWHYSLPAPDGLRPPAVHLYANGQLSAGGRPVATIYPSHRAQVWVPLERIPRSVVDAALVAEDRRFWSHPGVDLLAVGRAFHVNLKHGELREGGSTITQQLARTLFLDTRRTWGRKVREALIALLLEVRYSKTRILEAYLNSVYLGHDGDLPVYGLPAAARHFLGKDLGALDVSEAAWLASAIRAPNRMLSAQNREKKYRDGIILAMQEARLIEPATARQAVSRPLPRQPNDGSRVAPYFVDFVAGELGRRAKLPESGDVQLQTTLNLPLQRTAEAAVRDGVARIERDRPHLAGQVQAAVIAIEPASGEIRALVGGRRYGETSFNRATRAVRQPGSLFKPFVYLAAFEAERRGAGITPASVVVDEPLLIPAAGSNWEPRNMDGRFHGPVTVRRALEESLNIPAVRVALNVGPRHVADMARAVGIEHPLAPVPSLALGTSEVTLLEITSAFATLANGGVRVVPTALAADVSGGGPAMAPLPASFRAVSAESAFLINHLLRGVMRRGTGARSSAWGLQEVTAGKTGTTDGLRDAWFVGYTPDLVVGVWVGLDDATPLGLTGAQAALPIWGPVMQAAVRQSSPAQFTPPPGVVLAQIDRKTGRRVSYWCGSDDVIQEAFREGTRLPDECESFLQTGVTNLLEWIERRFK